MGIQKIAIGAALALTLTTPAAAQFLSFVSATGNDAASCFVQASPCKTLQRTINQTSAGGEIRILSTLPAQLVTVAKSLTIDGGDNTMIGTITINNASAIVRLRKLSLTGRHAVARGINIVNAAAVHIEESSVERYTGDGIFLAANVSTELVISNSVSRDNGNDGLLISGPTTAKVAIADSRFENNGDVGGGGIAFIGGQGSVARSTFLGNSGGLRVFGGTTTASDTTAAGNSDTGFLAVDGGLTLSSCDALGNGGKGVEIGGAPSGARIANCVFTGNDKGIANNFGGAAQTLGNNLIAGNTTNVEGTAPTLLPGE